MIPPTVPEVGRLIRAMMGPEEQRGFRLGWSLFRRAHQAVAKRCHKASHRNKHASEHHATTIEQDAPRRGGSDPTDPSEAGAPTTAGHHAKEAVFSPTPNGSALKCYCRGRSQAKGVPDAMTDRCFAGYCGSWTPALRGGIYQRKSLGPIARSTDGTANGAKKGSGLG